MKVVGILLARMGSSRLPGKSLADVCGKPLIQHIIGRMRGVEEFAEVILASPDLPADRPLLQAGESAGAKAFAGAENDVLDRLYQAARSANADIVVHIGGDCPFADRKLMKHALNLLIETQGDYVGNLNPMTFPGGLDTDAVTFSALERMWRDAKLKTTRVHCFSYIHQNPSRFHVTNFNHEPNLGSLRWTLDYPEDLEFVRQVYQHLGPKGEYFGMDDILQLLSRHPKIGKINAHLSDFVPDQPAYWDSEGYISDLREDLTTATADAVAADRAGDFTTAEEWYATAGNLLKELTDRSRSFARRKASPRTP